jgi:hypothetical protein
LARKVALLQEREGLVAPEKLIPVPIFPGTLYAGVLLAVKSERPNES